MRHLILLIALLATHAHAGAPSALPPSPYPEHQPTADIPNPYIPRDSTGKPVNPALYRQAPDPPGVWRMVGNNSQKPVSTSPCIGSAATPLCAVETVMACEAQSVYQKKCKNVTSEYFYKEYSDPYNNDGNQSWMMQVLYERYRLRYSGSESLSQIDYLKQFDIKYNLFINYDYPEEGIFGDHYIVILDQYHCRNKNGHETRPEKWTRCAKDPDYELYFKLLYQDNRWVIDQRYMINGDPMMR